MPHINENIDELFREAAEDYPLRTGIPDWEDVRNRVTSKNPATGNRFLIQILQQSAAVILFLLIPFSIALNNLKQNSIIKANSNMYANQETKTLPITSVGSVAGNMHQNIEKSSVENFNDRQVFYHENNAEQNIISVNDMQDNKALVTINSPATNDAMTSVNSTASKATPVISAAAETTNATKQITAENNKKRTFNITLSAPKNLYAGLLVSPELTNVKRQTFGKPGLNFGFLIGYNFSDRLQAEVAVIRAHKYYHTDGKYAAPNSIRHDELQVTGIDAFCSVTEIPLTLHYTFNDNGNTKFFASAGTVTSIVHRERYTYEYTKNGQEQQGFKKYNKSTENLFSNVQLSVGYEKKLGTIGNIRIEPYYRIPLNGIGASNLPVTSAGINFAVVKHFK